MRIPDNYVLPRCPEPGVFGTAREVFLRYARMSQMVPTILNLGCMSAMWLNWDLPQDLEPNSRSDYLQKGVLRQHWPGKMHCLPFIGTAMQPLAHPPMVRAFAQAGVVSRIHRYYASNKDYQKIRQRLQEELGATQHAAVIDSQAEREWEDLNIKLSVDHFQRLMQVLEEELGPEQAKVMMPIMAVAPTSGGMKHVRALVQAGCVRFDVDTMAGLPKSIRFLRELSQLKLGDYRFIISGSTDNPYDVLEYAKYCDAIDLGVGNGKSCSTRPELGIGAPQGWLLAKTAQLLDEAGLLYRNHGKGVVIIASGGNLQPRDRAVALALGADAATFGSSTQLCKESSAEPKQINGKWFIEVFGMASTAITAKFSASGTEDVPEGHAYMILLPNGPQSRRSVADAVRQAAKRLGGTLSAVGAPVSPSCLEFLRQVPLWFMRTPGAELENGTPGRDIIKG